MVAASRSPQTVAVLLAGGTGERFGAAKPKQLLEIAGYPVIEHSLATFESCPEVDDVVVVMAPGFIDQVEQLVAAGHYRKVSRVLEGGETRSESTQRALAALDDEATSDDSRVLFHDAVRPLVDHATIGACARALHTCEAVTAAVPSSDTMLVVEEDVITDIPSRSTLRRAQTPQGFRLSTLRAAYERAVADPGFSGAAATDGAAVVLRYLPETPVHTVPGSESNIKVTHPGDIPLAEALLAAASTTLPVAASGLASGTRR